MLFFGFPGWGALGMNCREMAICLFQIQDPATILGLFGMYGVFWLFWSALIILHRIFCGSLLIFEVTLLRARVFHGLKMAFEWT